MRLLKVLSTRSRVLLYFFHFCSATVSSFQLWHSPSARYLLAAALAVWALPCLYMQ